MLVLAQRTSLLDADEIADTGDAFLIVSLDLRVGTNGLAVRAPFSFLFTVASLMIKPQLPEQQTGPAHARE